MMDLYRMSLWQIILAAGPLVWPILICSVAAMAVVIDKFWYLHKINVDTEKLFADILDKIKHHQIKEALGICDSSKHPLTQVLKAGILKYDRSRSQIKEAIEDASLYEIPKLEKNLTALATIAHISPLLGFLGTITGMARIFQIIQAKASVMYPVSPADLASGIWEALLVTIAGLVLAIPAFVAYNYFTSRVHNVILDMEKAATELVNFLAE